MALSIVLSYEFFLRAQGYTPKIVDSMELWSLQRDKIHGLGLRKPLVFIGASRTLYGVDIPYFKQHLPGHNPLMLAINGHYPIALLNSLAADDSFSGVVLVDIDARGLSKYNHAMQKKYIDFYHNDWTLSKAVHRFLLSYWQNTLVVGNADFSATKSVVRYLENQPMPSKNNVAIDPDRNSGLDFSMVDSQALILSFADGLRADLDNNPPLPPDSWLTDLELVALAAEKIKNRGGRVIFYVPPVKGQQYSLAEQAYPKAKYWDRFIKKYSLDALHYKDIVGMQDISLPDESHIDQHSKKYYSSLLLKALQSRDLL